MEQRILDAAAVGLLVVDEELRVSLWNRWMEDNSGLERDQVIGQVLGDLFPDVNFDALRRRVRQVLTLGTSSFFDASVDGHVFPFRNEQQLGRRFDYMQQNCVLSCLEHPGGGPRRVCLTVSDQTNWMTAEAALKEAHAQIEQRSRRDALTDLFHRGYVCERLEHEILRVQRSGGPLSVLLLDVDWFKKVNDTWGHLAGDEVLRQVAASLRATVRQTELVGRYGGEEFVVVVPGTDESGAAILGERVREAIALLEVPWEDRLIRVTASVGVAEYEPPEDLDDLLIRADSALYDAKARGRDRTRAASLLPGPTKSPPPADDEGS